MDIKTEFSKPDNDTCEVCGGMPPPGHRICDNCWPDAAVAVGRAVVCAQCGRTRLLEKLTELTDGSRVCMIHTV